MERKRILIVDDEPDLRGIVAFNLRAAGYECATATGADEALAADPATFNLLLLDVMMPGLSGFDLARRLRADERTAALPIIFITAKDTETDKLDGFAIGADDYVAKPFSVKELVARVGAVLHRSAPATEPTSTMIQDDGLVLNMETKSVSTDGLYVPFTPTEFALLRLLMTHKGKVFTRQELLKKVWPADVVVTARTVDVNVTRIRKKIGRHAVRIVTKPGFGYTFS
ncbi:MAG: response regulator transcription factor [Bacteroidaceae bacterium]|nr:response regulator transcription factor [Bacteroidaceae bacterium]